MKKSPLYTLCALVLLLILTGCRNGNTVETEGKSIEMQYAELLSLHQGDGYITAEIRNPWDSAKVLHRYVLIQGDKEEPANLPEGDIVRIPLKHSVVCTSVHASLIDQFGAYSSIAGVCDKDFMYLKRLQQDIKSGKVADCGNSMTPNIERVIDLSPDAILLSPFENSGTYGKLGKLNVPIIECADYMEASPLGRAEWMRFYGLLFGCSEKADSIFAAVEKSYRELKAKVKDVKMRPTVLADMKYGATWYISGAKSTTGQFFADAGADYIFKDVESAGSLPYDPEVVFDRAQKADIWVVKYNQATTMTYAQMAQDWVNYAQFDAYKKHNVYACNLSNVPFYEEVPFHPELLLRDYVIIFHPELMPGEKTRYFKRIEK